jgi:hypothetical protein
VNSMNTEVWILRKKQSSQSEQSDRFIKAARELGADQSEEAFDEALRKLARAPAVRQGKLGGERIPANRRARKANKS